MLLPLRTIHLSGGKEGKEGVQKNPKQLFLDISSMSPVSSSLPTLVCTDLRKQVNAEEGTGLQIQRDRGVISRHAEYQLWGVFVISLGCGVFSGKIGSANDNYMTCNHVCQVPRIRGFPGAAVVKKKKKSACQQETQVWSLGQEDPLEKEMATHSSVLAWETHGQRSLAGYTVHGVTKNQTQLSEHKKHLKYGRLNNSEFFPWNFSCSRSLPWASPCLCLQIRGSKEKLSSLSHLLSLHPPPAWFGRFILQRQNRLSPCQAVGHNTLPLPLKGETGFIHVSWFLSKMKLIFSY